MTKCARCSITRSQLAILIVSLLLAPLSIGCSGRQGPFLEVGGGIGPVYADQHWFHWSIGSGARRRERTVIASPLAGSLKLGYGITQRLVVSQSFNVSKLSSMGLGLTAFHRTSAPSLFLDMTLGSSYYWPTEFPVSDAIFQGPGGAVGIGYEFREHLAVKAQASWGTHDYDKDTPTVSAEGESSSYALAILFSYLLY